MLALHSANLASQMQLLAWESQAWERQSNHILACFY